MGVPTYVSGPQWVFLCFRVSIGLSLCFSGSVGLPRAVSGPQWVCLCFGASVGLSLFRGLSGFVSVSGPQWVCLCFGASVGLSLFRGLSGFVSVSGPSSGGCLWVIPCQMRPFLAVFSLTPSDFFYILHSCRT